MTAEKPMVEQCGDRRLQSVADVFIAVVVAMLVWPFPIARAMLTPVVHVAGVLITCLIVLCGYYVLSAVLWKRTLGMRLAGLTLVPASSHERAHYATWGLVSAVLAGWYALAPRSACAHALPEGMSGVRVESDGS